MSYIKRLISITLLIISPNLFAFTFANHTRYPVDIDFDYSGYWMTHSYVVMPGQVDFQISEGIHGGLANYTIVVKDYSRMVKFRWILRHLDPYAPFDLVDIPEHDRIELFCFGQLVR